MNKKSILTNFFWRFAERIGAQLVGFIVSVVLARILEPSVYGTVALITVFTTILQVFVDSGLGNALIQKKDADNIDFSTVFYTNVIFCTILYVFLFFLSPTIAYYYGNAQITAYLRVLGLTVFISGIKNVQQAYVSRNMLFKKFFFSTLGGTITAGIIGVIMALNNYGVWALVAQQVINLAIDTIILWVTVKWRPEKAFSFERLKTLFSFGWKLLVSGLIDAVYNDVCQLVIGKIYSSADLAQYNRGRQFPHLIVTNVNTSIDSVLLPVMASSQDNFERVKEMTKRAIIVSTYIMAPLLVGLLFVGEPLIRLVLGEKWLPSVWFMRVFCITFMFYPIHTANLNAIKAVGRSDLFLRMEIQKKAVGIIALIATMFVSVKAMALSLIFTTIAALLINALPNKKIINYGFYEQLTDILPSICLSFAMGLIIYQVQKFGLPDLVTLAVQVPLGVLIYILGSRAFKLEPFYYLWGVVSPRIRKRG